MFTRPVKVGLLGLGTVGGGVARMLLQEKERLSSRLGAELVLKRAVDLDPALAKDQGIPPERFSTEADAVLDDPEIDIVVELIGGLEPARSFMLKAINSGKQVATANKMLLAHHGVEIFAAARKRRVSVAFEAAVGGGIPLIRSLREGLAADHIESCLGILNGTCNYILSRMTSEGTPFQEVLSEAQAKGYAEADPTMDVEGLDTAHKLAIVAALITGAQPDIADIYTEGISAIEPVDIQLAGEFGYRVKLLAILRNLGGKVEARVHPALVPTDHVLASIEGPFNALHIHGDWVGDVLLYGQGAGRRPTTSAVMGDVMDLARGIVAGCPDRVPPLGDAGAEGGRLEIAPMDDTVCQYYFRCLALDQPGVLATVSRVLADHRISIKSVIQKGRSSSGPVNIVMVTHEAREKAVRAALKEIDQLPVIAEPTRLIRRA